MTGAESEVDKLLKQLKKLLKMGRTAGRQNYNGGVFFWTVAQTRTREPLR
jgi:hypothetical protein